MNGAERERAAPLPVAAPPVSAVGGLVGEPDRFERLVDGIDGIVWEADAVTFAFSYVSARAEGILGYPTAQWLGDPGFWVSIVHPEDRDATVAACQAATEAGRDHRLEYRVLAADGRQVWLTDLVRVVCDDAGRPVCLRGVMFDDTPRHDLQGELRRHVAFHTAVLDSLPYATVVLDEAGRVTSCNVAQLALPAADGQPVTVGADYVAGLRRAGRHGVAHAAAAATGILRVLTGDAGEFQLDFPVHLDGRERWYCLVAAPLLTGGGAVVSQLDVTWRKELERHLEFDASHDPMTGLLNRRALVAAAAVGMDPVVLSLDVDGFAVVNDSVGHGVGDGLLRQLAARLTAGVDPDAVVARASGDEFLILLPHADIAAGRATAERLLAALRDPFLLPDGECFLTASVGIAGRRPGEPAETVAQHADAAMREAKRRGRAQVAVFDDAQRARVVTQLTLAGRLRRAVDDGLLQLVYQPLFDLATGHPTGAEALVRWTDDEFGPVPPSEFIPLAERTGLINAIDQYVLDSAVGTATGWPSAPAGRVNVNVSARQLADPRFVDQVTAVLRRANLPAHRLCLEITETSLMIDVEASCTVLDALRGLGVRVAIDDFGTGYSSLVYLRRFAVDELKLDRALVNGSDTDRQQRAILTHVVALAHDLGLHVVGEGVETRDELALLAGVDVDAAQGYLLGRPAVHTQLSWTAHPLLTAKTPRRRIPGSSQRSVASGPRHGVQPEP